MQKTNLSSQSVVNSNRIFTDMRMEEIAVRIGMTDANYFSRMFKKLRIYGQVNIEISGKNTVLTGKEVHT